jgi:hypothetical protein
MKRLVAFAVAALFSTVALGQAETPAPPPSSTSPANSPAPPSTDAAGSIFDTLDADHDTSISPPEAQAHPTVAQHFATADANGDGKLSREEFGAAFKTQ